MFAILNEEGFCIHYSRARDIENSVEITLVDVLNNTYIGRKYDNGWTDEADDELAAHPPFFGITMEDKIDLILAILLKKESNIEFNFTPEAIVEGTSTKTLVAEGKEGEEWRPGVRLNASTSVLYKSQEYKVVTGHLTQAGWEPDKTPALFEPVKEDFAPWVQPHGHNPYMKGDKVTYNGKKYISAVDGNVHAPGIVAGNWQEV